eukprot:TRINITY_DN23256_c0_g1_i1.p1 TRINITY_DN23256_c0_g1~~TRINITY_DN23256_c0_g1_i1.p1  ORF type:complete len:237 (+),score=32.07 TRINITY_DN23256_c0_g1_i1:42-713(+)
MVSQQLVSVVVKNTFIHAQVIESHLQRRNSAPAVLISADVPEVTVQECISDQSAQQNTTVMFRNIPETYTREMLVDLFERNGFHGSYDFLYLPVNFKSDSSFGYAFVNLVDIQALSEFRLCFNGFKDWGCDTNKVAEVSLNCKLQGLQEHVKRYRDSPVMSHTVPDKYKPIILHKGIRVHFPSPTKKIKPPSRLPEVTGANRQQICKRRTGIFAAGYIGQCMR